MSEDAGACAAFVSLGTGVLGGLETSQQRHPSPQPQHDEAEIPGEFCTAPGHTPPQGESSGASASRNAAKYPIDPPFTMLTVPRFALIL